MSRHIFHLFLIQLIVINVKSASVFDVIKENPLKSAVKTDGVISDVANELFNNSAIQFIKNGVTLNCFGIPVELFEKIFELIFTRNTKASDVRFYFYSRDQKLPVTVKSKAKHLDLSKINFSPNRRTVIISHGFMSRGTEDWVTNMTRAFLQMDDYNVIAVDWEKGSNTWNYVEASISTRIVGTQIAKLLYKIKSAALATNASSSETFGLLHLVGHSLGAHISAHASYKIRELQKNDASKWIVHRISGLDPAQPCFKTADLALKLSKNDADYVDVIHSNGRQLLYLGLGLPDQLGMDDFYPNGGQIQLGCNNIDSSFWKFLALPVNIIETTVCSHGRSHELFTDSIEVKLSGACTYQGRKWNQKYENLTNLLKEQCDDVCPELGINAINYYIPGKEEKYFVPTGDNPPFCDITKQDRKAIEKQLRTDEFYKDPFAGLVNNVILAPLTEVDKILG